MSFDIALGMDENGLTQVLAVLFKRPSLRSRIFSGSEPVDLPGVKATVSYELEAPPIVKLRAPTVDQWKHAIKADGSLAQPTQNAMIVTLPKLKLTRPDERGHAQQATISLDAIVTVAIQNDILAYHALAAIIDLSGAKPFDQIIYKKFVIPRVLKAVSSAFGQPHIPNISFRGLSFGSIILEVGEGRLVGISNLANKPAPAAVPLGSLPNEPFFILLSREATQAACQSGTAGLVGKTAGKDGSASFGIGNASYHGQVRLDAVSVQVANDPTVVNASIAVSASANAGINVLDTIWQGIKTGANAVADAGKTAGNAIADTAKTGANAVADTAKTAANAVADGAKTAANAVAHAFRSY